MPRYIASMSSSSDYPMPVILEKIKLPASEFCASRLPNGEELREFSPANNRWVTTPKRNLVAAVNLFLKRNFPEVPSVVETEAPTTDDISK